MSSPISISLLPHYFGERERHLISYSGFEVSTFTYSTGVAGLRIKNRVGEIEVLPFQGQQIWKATFYGRDLTMESMFPEPRQTTKYLETYGAFLIHCGISGMGAPSATDNHEIHGELPNARFHSATVLLGEDSQGSYVGVTGSYQHTVAFSQNYLAQPTLMLREDDGRIGVDMKVTNLKNSSMELMYLAHINFRPVANGKLIDTVPASPEAIRVIHVFQDIYESSAEYRAMIEGFKKDPESHRFFDPAGVIDPEVVFALKPKADEAGWTSSLQLHPNGEGDFVRHKPSEFTNSLRWICRSGDQRALGLLLPSTAEPSGYIAEKAKGNVLEIASGGSMSFSYECGALTAKQTQELIGHIDDIRKK